MLYIFDKTYSLPDDFSETVKPLLSIERYEKIQKLKSKKNKTTSAVAYLLLRLALKDAYSIDEVVTFEYQKLGKPTLRKFPDIHFSISHSKNAAASAVAGLPIGVDIQNISSVSDKAAKRVLTADEYLAYKEADRPDEYFCEIWSIKESFLKKSGKGITEEMGHISADDIDMKTVVKGEDYFCCVCGAEMEIKHIRREDFEQLR